MLYNGYRHKKWLQKLQNLPAVSSYGLIVEQTGLFGEGKF